MRKPVRLVEAIRLMLGAGDVLRCRPLTGLGCPRHVDVRAPTTTETDRMRKLALIAVLGLAGCSTFTPSVNPDGTPGKSKVQEVAEQAAPFLPSPWGDLLKLGAAVGTAIAGGHVLTKRHVKKHLAAGAPPAKPAV